MIKDNYDITESSPSNLNNDLNNFSEGETSTFSAMTPFKEGKGIYENNYSDKICCIELINNNKIYITYEPEWTIRDVKLFLI